jgi:hypothetical protein
MSHMQAAANRASHMQAAANRASHIRQGPVGDQVRAFLERRGRPEIVYRNDIVEIILPRDTRKGRPRSELREVRKKVSICLDDPEGFGYVIDCQRRASNPRFRRVRT